MKKIIILIWLFLLYLSGYSATIVTGITSDSDWEAWEDSTDIDLVTAQKIHIAEIRNSFTGSLKMEGAYSNSQYYRMVTVADSNRLGGTGTRAVITAVTDSAVIEVKERHVIIDGLKLTASIYETGIYIHSENSDSSCYGCIVRYCEVYTCRFGIYNFAASGNNGGNIQFYSNFVWDCEDAGIRCYQNDSTIYVWNNTILDSDRGLWLDAPPVQGKNNVCLNNSTADFQLDANFSTGSINNLSSDATAGGARAMINKTASDVIVSTSTPDLHLKSGSVAVSTGSDLSAYFTTDIDQDLIGSEWSRGADFNSSYDRTFTIVYMKPVESNAWAGQDCVYSTLDSCWDKASEFDEIWIAEGRYDTDTHTFPLTIKSNVDIFGGFEGWETTKEERGLRWRYIKRSVFDAENDTSVFESDITENTSFTIDGLKIVNGRKLYNKGAGLYLSGSSHPIYATISNCWFDSCACAEVGYPDGPGGNLGGAQGAAINIDNSSDDGGEITVEYTVAVRCTAICGAFEIMNDATPTVTVDHCIIANNRSYGMEIRTGTLANTNHTITNTISTGNDNARYGTCYENFWGWACDSSILFNSYAGGCAWPDSTANDLWSDAGHTILFGDTVGWVGFFDSTNVDIRMRGSTKSKKNYGAFPLIEYFRIIQ